MTIARHLLVEADRPGCYHLVSRCVRRAFLCGDTKNHRRDWIAGELQRLSPSFAAEILGFAVMSNHFHLVIRANPQHAEAWSDEEVAQRWLRLFPQHFDDDGKPIPPTAEELRVFTGNERWIAQRRERLKTFSWLMKILKERIARRANKEDGCTGHFWEGRFTSVRLLDQAAVTAAMVYVDLNPIRAKMASTPETSVYTSVRERIAIRQAHRKAAGLEQRHPRLASATLARLAHVPQHDEDGLWFAPIDRCIVDGRSAQQAPGLDEYLQLVDATGRIIKAGKRGSIPDHLKPILERLQIDVDSWIDTMTAFGRLLGTAIGCAALRAAEAIRRGTKWIVDKAGFYRSDQLQT